MCRGGSRWRIEDYPTSKPPACSCGTTAIHCGLPVDGISDLVALVFALARSGRGALSAAAIAAYIGSAYFFTSSTSFANPAVTVARTFSDTFAGIAPASVLPFVLAQLVGGAIGVGIVLGLYPDVAAAADDVVVPHENAQPSRAS